MLAMLYPRCHYCTYWQKRPKKQSIYGPQKIDFLIKNYINNSVVIQKYLYVKLIDD